MEKKIRRNLLKNRLIICLHQHFIHYLPTKKNREVFLVEVSAFASTLSILTPS